MLKNYVTISVRNMMILNIQNFSQHLKGILTLGDFIVSQLDEQAVISELFSYYVLHTSDILQNKFSLSKSLNWESFATISFEKAWIQISLSLGKSWANWVLEPLLGNQSQMRRTLNPNQLESF